MTSCRCNCGQPARTAKGYTSRRCAMQYANHLRVERALAKRGQAPLCAYCGVCHVKWYKARAHWNTYCDKVCANNAIHANTSPEQRERNNSRLRAFVLARRLDNPAVRMLVAEALRGRESLSAVEVMNLALTADRGGWKRGYNAHGAAKTRAAAAAAATEAA